MKRDPSQALPLIHALSAAVNYRTMYPESHPRVGQGVQAVIDTLAGCLADRGREEITFLIIEQELLVDDRPIRERSLRSASIVRTLAGFGIERLTLAAGLTVEECHDLVRGLARGGVRASDHVVLGRIQEAESGGGGPAGEALPRLTSVEVSEEHVDQAEDGFLRFASDRQGSVRQLDQILWHFVEGLDASSRSLLMLGPIKRFDQKVFAHSINVSLLVLAQARSLGIGGQALHDIGLAAMLHDIGKLSLPRELQDSCGRFTDQQFELVALHPEIGAAQLAGLEGVPPLAVLVAYEHHLRWDGKPSYPLPTTPRKPNLASQLTAIADTYDAIVASRTHDGSVHSLAARKVWRKRSETYLDPFLVGNFVLMVSAAEQATDGD